MTVEGGKGRRIRYYLDNRDDDYDNNGYDDGDGDDDDIYYDEVSVCLSVTKNHHFLLGVSCNHPGWFFMVLGRFLWFFMVLGQVL